MKVNDKFYVLQNKRNPIKFLVYGENDYEMVDTIQSADLYKNRTTAQYVLEDYNIRTLHTLADDLHVVEVNVTYEF